jgi:hypothetical protein
MSKYIQAAGSPLPDVSVTTSLMEWVLSITSVVVDKTTATVGEFQTTVAARRRESATLVCCVLFLVFPAFL